MAVTDALLLSQNLYLALLCRNQFLLLCKKKVCNPLGVILEAADKCGAGAGSAIDVEPTCSGSWSEMTNTVLTGRGMALGTGGGQRGSSGCSSAFCPELCRCSWSEDAPFSILGLNIHLCGY